MPPAVHMHPEDWIDQIFATKSVVKGGVIRRAVRWVDNEIGIERFKNEVRLDGFHLLEGGGQFIVIYNPAPIRKLI